MHFIKFLKSDIIRPRFGHGTSNKVLMDKKNV